VSRELVIEFLKETLPVERVTDIEKSLNILEEYDYSGIYSKMTNIIMSESIVDKEEIANYIESDIREMLAYVLEQHALTLRTDTDLPVQNDILTALLNIQTLEDYSSLINIVYSSEDETEVLSEIVGELTGLDKVKVMSAIEDLNPDILDRLKEFIEAKNIEIADNSISDIGERLKLYFELVGSDNVVKVLLDSGIALGGGFKEYTSLMEALDFDTPASISNAILGVILMSGVAIDDVLDFYTENSEELLGNLTDINNVYAILLTRTSDLQDLRDSKIEDNKLREQHE